MLATFNFARKGKRRHGCAPQRREIRSFQIINGANLISSNAGDYKGCALPSTSREMVHGLQLHSLLHI